MVLFTTHLAGLIWEMWVKSDHWSYESEWRLIVELSDTMGTGSRDSRGLPINFVRVPNEAVVSVFHTERTPIPVVKKVCERLQNPRTYGPVVARVIEPPCGPVDGLLSPLGLRVKHLLSVEQGPVG